MKSKNYVTLWELNDTKVLNDGLKKEKDIFSHHFASQGNVKVCSIILVFVVACFGLLVALE